MAESPGKILLVDDDDTVREVLAEHLGAQGFEVLQAADGEQGVVQALERRPDLIIADIVMPVMDGWDFCHTLRLMPSTRTIPFVFLTSLDKTPDRILGLKLGADDYLTKPFSPEEVVFKVKEIIGRVSRRRKLLEKRQADLRETDAGVLLSDVIEYLRHTRRTGVVAVYGRGKEGCIYIENGQPLHASFGSMEGEAALYEMLKLKQSQVKYLDHGHSELKPNITTPWETLVSRLLSSPSSAG